MAKITRWPGENRSEVATKILLVEDEESLQDAIRLNLELEGYEVVAYANGKEALAGFERQPFDLAVLDVMLPGMDGFTLCQEIRLRDEQTPVLFLTAKNASQDRIQGLRIGADDYLAKPFSLEEFLLRVQILLKRGAASVEQKTAVNSYAFGNNNINFLTYEVTDHSAQSRQLSKREIKLLRLLIDRKNEVVSRKEILDVVWGYDVYPSSRTIDNYILGFRKYFEVDPKNPVFFHSVRGVGYKFVD